ncbi:MAG: glycosyltransferase family 39 protein [Myxococcales bacterium]|nr:glycosyltransferase family 39 protein [Myxococcales bacterium]
MRVVVAALTHSSTNLQNDDLLYVEMAHELIATGVLDTGDFVRPPLYFLFIAALSLGNAPWMVALKGVQCIAGTLVAVPVYGVARRIGGTFAARVAAAVVLFDPTLIAYCHLLWPETLYLLLVTWVFARATLLRVGSGWRIPVLGAVTGLAMLLKPVFGLFTLFLAGAWWRDHGFRPALRIALGFGLATALVISPWVIRNQRAYGASILLENQGPYNLWVGNTKDSPFEVLEEWRALPDPVARSRAGMQRGLAAIAEAPIDFVNRSIAQGLNVWGFEFFVIRNLIFGGYGSVAPATLLAAFWTIQLAWTLVLALAALGVRRARHDRGFALILGFAVALTLLVGTMVGTTRFRVPLTLLVAVSAGVGAEQLRARRLEARDLVAAGLAGIVLFHSFTRPVFVRIIGAQYEKVEELRDPAWFFFRY